MHKGILAKIATSNKNIIDGIIERDNVFNKPFLFQHIIQNIK
jgi:hypothetical protein